jgi:transcription termination/antitermination protein NusA
MVVSELRGEKIDIIPYNEEPARFVAKALSPARVREVLVDDETKEATVIVPDDQLSLAIGRDGQNARLAARLTGWKVDITSETEFAQQEEDIEYEGEEAADGRCMAVMTTGRRCPNAALQGSQFCGLPQHQALARFSTNQVAVLSPLTDEEVATLAGGDADDATVKTIVEKAEGQFDESAEAEEPEEAEEPDEAETPEEAEAPEEIEESEEAEESEEPEEAAPAAEAEAEVTEPEESGIPEAGDDAEGPEQDLEPETDGESDRGEATEASEDGGEPEETTVTAGEEQTTE